MRSKASSSLSIMKYDIRRFWYVPALFTLSLMAGGPIACLLITSPGKERVEYLKMMASNENPLFFFLFFMMALAAGLGVFEYLQKSRISNYVHSLPISRDRLFGTNYLTGLLMIIVPILVTGIIMMFFGYDPAGFLSWILIGVLAGATIYSVTVFAGIVSGNIFMHLFNSLFFSFVLFMLIAAVDGYAGMLLYGYISPEIVDVISLKSLPMVALYSGGNILSILIYLAVFILLTIISAKIYTRRAIENTGESLVFTWTKSLIVGIVTFLGTCFMGGMFRGVSTIMGSRQVDFVLLVGMAFGFVLTFLIISVIVYKGIRIFSRQNLAAGLIVMVVTALFTAGMSADVIGYEKKVFDPNEFSSAGITGELAGYNMRLEPTIFNISKDKTMAGNPVGEIMYMYQDPSNIGAVCDIQKKLSKTEDRKPVALFRDGEVDAREILIKSRKQNGGIMSRDYTNLDKETLALVKEEIGRLFESTEFKEDFALSNLKYKVINVDASMYGKGDGNLKAELDIRSSEYAKLITALDRDFQTMTYDQFKKADSMNMSDKPSEDYYTLFLTLSDEDKTEFEVIVTKDQAISWKWLNDESKGRVKKN